MITAVELQLPSDDEWCDFDRRTHQLKVAYVKLVAWANNDKICVRPTWLAPDEQRWAKTISLHNTDMFINPHLVEQEQRRILQVINRIKTQRKSLQADYNSLGFMYSVKLSLLDVEFSQVWVSLRRNQ